MSTTKQASKPKRQGAPRGLGRGLGALIPHHASSFNELPLDAISPNSHQPRQDFREDSLESLAASITEVGVLQPVVVRSTSEDGRYELVAGERRWRAARIAELPTIPAIVRDSDETASLVEAVIENVQREDLNPLEEAAAYRQLIDDFGLTHEEVGKRVGKSRTAVTNSLRLLGLPPAVHVMVVERLLSAGHARALLSLTDDAVAERLANEAVRTSMTVRELETRVSTYLGRATGSGRKSGVRSKSRRSKRTVRLSAAALDAQDAIAEALATEVTVEPAALGGRVVIRYADKADLQRIRNRIIE